MIGQTRVKELTRLTLTSGKNVLIVGPSGYGKTMLAIEACPGKYILLGEPEPPMDIIDYPLWNCPSRYIICNEIHASKKMDDWALFLDSFSGACVFTTTNPEKLIEAIKTRTILVELEEYSEEELMMISEVFEERFAELSRGIPRKAKNLGEMYKNFGGSFEEFLDLLGMEEMYNHYLFPEERRYLEVLGDKVLGRNLLFKVVNIANFEEVERGLLRLGLLEITERGRKCPNV
jgi:hypothetical protein